MIRPHHHAEVRGFICPVDGKFVVPEHFLDRHDDRCFDGAPIKDHQPALQVIDIYVQVPDA